MKLIPRARSAEFAKELALALGLSNIPVCRIGRGRVTVTFRQQGASRWTEEQKIDYAAQVADAARDVLESSSKRTIRRRAKRAVVVVYEDAMLVHGYDSTARWEIVIPVSGLPTRR